MPEDEASCTESYDNEDCLFHAKQREKFLGSGREIEQRDGELVAFSESPEWAKGINIILASGAEFKALMARADSLDKLKMIGKLRGYHPRWALHAWNRRQHNG